jgi:hypothetical protein
MDAFMQSLPDWLGKLPWETIFTTVLSGLLLALIVWIAKKIFGIFQEKGRIDRKWQDKSFERRYLNSLDEREHILTIKGLGGPWGDDIDLSSIYVPLKLAPRVGDLLNGEELISCTPPNCDRYTAEDILRSNDRVAILGQPGSGKSTLVSYLALQHARNWRMSSRLKNLFLGLLDKYHGSAQRSLPLPFQKRFPILVRLRALQNDNNLQLIVNDLPRLCAGDNIATICPDSFFDRRLKTGHCIVFLDGLDEVSEEKRSKVREQIYNLATDADYKSNIFVLTSRSTS